MNLTRLSKPNRAKMKAEVDAFNEEKKRMQAFVVKDDDIIHLNVGGQKFTSKRSTLCQVEGFLFATMFSGRKIVLSVIKMELFILILIHNILSSISY